jgi:hypothetical protein
MIISSPADRPTIIEISCDPWTNRGYQAPPDSVASSSPSAITLFRATITERLSQIEKNPASFEEVMKRQDLHLLFDIAGFPESPTPSSESITRSPSIQGLSSTLKQSDIKGPLSAGMHQENFTSVQPSEAQEYASSPQVRIQVEFVANDKEFESAPATQANQCTASWDRSGSKFNRFLQRFTKIGISAPHEPLKTQRPFSLFIHRKRASNQA